MVSTGLDPGGQVRLRGRMKRTALLLPALALALSSLAGCGGSDEEPLTHDEFVTQADKICADGSADLETAAADLGDAPTEEDISSFVDDTLVPNLQDQHDAIEDLAAPDDDQDAVDDMLSALQDAIDGLDDDPSMITGETNPFEDANAAADEVGLSECGSN